MTGPPASGLSAAVAAWVAGLEYEHLPPATVEAAKTRLLDTLAVTWAGSDEDGIRPLRDLLVEQGGRPAGTVLAFGDRLPAAGAALLNSAMGAALDFDGLHDGCGVHTDITVIPAVLAVAEDRGASGRDVITALCAGQEVLIRLANSAGTGPGWFYSSVFGVLAAALAVGRILGLDAAAMNAALGVAYCNAGGSQQNLVEGCLTKRLQTGFAAQAGVTAAQLAAAGVGGPLQSLEGRFGVHALFAPVDEEVLLGDLGRTWHLQQVTVKKYPSCFCNHAAIEAALSLACEHDLQPGRIDSVAVTVPTFVERVVGGAWQAAGATQAAAQFSLAYSVACALTRRDFGLADVGLPRIRDPGVAALAGKVRIQADPVQHGRFTPVRLEVRLHNGDSLSREVTDLPGTPARPMDRRGLEHKVRECFSRGVRPIPAGAVENLCRQVARADRLADVRPLVAPGAADGQPTVRER